MIKQTWEISNEERNRIISLHESATKNLYLMSEQINVSYKGPFKVLEQGGLDMIISTKDPRVIKMMNEYSIQHLAYATGRGWNNKTNTFSDKPDRYFNEALNDMTRAMDEKSLEVFNTMAIENPKFYLLVFHLFMGPKNRGVKKRSIYGDNIFDQGRFGTKNKKIVVDNSTTIQEELKPSEEIEPKDSGVEQGYEMITPPTIQQPVQFEFNEAVMTPAFIEYINKTIFGGIDEAIKAMNDTLIKGGRKPAGVWVNKLSIKASSSTIPNGVSKKTFPGKIPTFQELSEERAKVVYNYLVEGLKQRNSIINPEGIEIDSKGTNSGKQITVNSGNQTLKFDGTGTSGPEYKGQNKDEFKKYQRVDLTFEFAVKGETPPKSEPEDSDEIPPQFIPTSQTDFTVRFTAKGRKRYRWAPNFQIQLPTLKSSGYYTKKVQMRCFYY
jgi:outer membrane protein OmpA-like peptidoglycan-associated protein